MLYFTYLSLKNFKATYYIINPLAKFNVPLYRYKVSYSLSSASFQDIILKALNFNLLTRTTVFC